MKSWEKTEPREVRASTAYRPENMAITRISVPYAGSASHAFVSAPCSRLMLGPSLWAEASSIYATENLQPVNLQKAPVSLYTYTALEPFSHFSGMEIAP